MRSLSCATTSWASDIADRLLVLSLPRLLPSDIWSFGCETLHLHIGGIVTLRNCRHGNSYLLFRSRHGDDFTPLQHCQCPEGLRILRSIVAPSTAFMAFSDSKITGCSSIRSEVICDQLVWDKAIFLQQLAHQFGRRLLVASGLDQHVEDFALGTHGAPEVDQATIDLEMNLIKMPDGVGL